VDLLRHGDGGSAAAVELHRLGSGQGGEFVVHYSTTEGDPITDYLRVTPNGTTEIYTDSTQDERGDKKWSYGTCGNPESVLDVVC
jgi:hypothetical protein